MKLIGSLALLGLAAANSVQDAWTKFKHDHNKIYLNKNEEVRRQRIFAENMDFIKDHNSRYVRGLETFHVGVNKFADLTNMEFNARYLSPNAQFRQNYQCPVNFAASGNPLPSGVDWRSTANPQNTVAVTGVKDQGQCGSCWAFGTTGTFEGQVCLSGAQDCSSWGGASEQQLVDCGGKDNTDLGNYYDMACNGGWIDNGLYYIQVTGYIDSETSYPYVSGNGRSGSCSANPGNGVGTQTTCGATVKKSESDLQGAIAEVGPVGIAIDAGGLAFQMYSGGVYTSSTCSSTSLNHAVLAVGYDTDSSGQDYWIVKNSWGTGWGDSGFILMRRNYNNMCGVAATPAYPILN